MGLSRRDGEVWAIGRRGLGKGVEEKGKGYEGVWVTGLRKKIRGMKGFG